MNNFSKQPHSASTRGKYLIFPAFLILGLYRWLLRPIVSALFGPTVCCRFYPSCSQYAQESLSQHGVFKGCLLTLGRLFRCQPYHAGGIDVVPKTFQFKTLWKTHHE